MKKVLITGGSSGVGYALSRHFARDGYHLIWVSKSSKELMNASLKLKDEFPDVMIDFLTKDLTTDGAVKEVYNWITEKFSFIDVLVNNAGFGTYGFFTETSIEKEMAMIQLNVTTVYLLTKLFLGKMVERNEGKILNVSSGVSFSPVPKMSVYAGTKAFVRQMSESIYYELKQSKSKVTITAVCPSAIKDTSFQKEADMKNVSTFEGFFATTVEEVAKDAYLGMIEGKRIVLTGSKYRAGAALNKITPSFITQFAVEREMKRKVK